ncbi:ABC transporter permease [Anaerobacillus sp. MEB173]|uniref:ABC transporter permease n=1 Tax=Anaerobacillus sp. MEB173 TaxID=3383345 RepID=UPI003F8FBC7E
MNQWLTLFNKELLEMWRNFKWIWLPLVFIILGMTDPLSSYYLPVILEIFGGLPEGAVLEIPKPTSNQVLLMAMNQLNTLGMLIIVLAFMGIIASERKSGLAAIILVKPIPISKYITAKWVSLLLIGMISLFLGYFTGWYYTTVLFGPVAFGLFLKSFLIFALWYLFILTMTLFYSAIVKVSGLAAFLTLFTIIVLSVATNLLGDFMNWSPAQLTDSIGSLVMVGQVADSFWLPVMMTILLSAAMVISAVTIFKNKELA